MSLATNPITNPTANPDAVLGSLNANPNAILAADVAVAYKSIFLEFNAALLGANHFDS